MSSANCEKLWYRLEQHYDTRTEFMRYQILHKLGVIIIQEKEVTKAYVL